MIASMHFHPPIPIPGGDEREVHFYASDGWSIDRRDDGQVVLTKGTQRLVVDGWSYTYSEASAMTDRGAEPAAEGAPVSPSTKRQRGRKP